MEQKPQFEQQHPAEWQRDLNPAHLQGQNQGAPTASAAQQGHTAHDVKSLHRSLAEYSDDELKQIPIRPQGTRLQQGATYFDLGEPERGEFTAMGGMEAEEGSAIVPKQQTPYTLWNRIIGVDNPERL